MSIRRAAFGSSAYEECLELRRVELREPLGLSWSEADLALEEEEWQMGVWEGEELAGCVSVRWLGEGRVKLRQMAVARERQGSGVGRVLLEGVLANLREEGVVEVELHSREEAAGFYEKLGFVAEGERFEEVGIGHWLMKLRI